MDKSALSEIERLFKDNKDEQEFVNLVLDLESDSENISKDLMTLLIDVISDCYGLDSLVAAEEEKAAQRQRREIIAQKKGRTGDGYLGDDDDSGGQGSAPKPPVDEAERKKKAGGTMDFLKVFFALLQLCEPATRIELVGRLNDKIKSSGLRAEMELDKRKGTQTLLDTLQHTSKSYSNMLISKRKHRHAYVHRFI